MTSLFLTKLLSLFLFPLGAAILLGATALALTFTKWRKLGQVLLAFVLIGFWVAATPFFANLLNWHLVSRIPQTRLEARQPTDAVILLGGGSQRRVLYALRMFREGRAPRIVISGGNLHWHPSVPDAQRMANLLVELGAPSSALTLEARSRTTRENAINTAAVFKKHGWRTGLLVTSGFHMPRALAAFRTAGLDVMPAATDTHVEPPRVRSPFDILPDAAALSCTTAMIKEMIGWWVYRYRGWA